VAIVHLPKLKEQAVSWACFLRWGRVPRVVANRISSRWAATPPEPELRHATCPGLQDADDARKLLEAEGAEVLLLPYDLTEGDPTCRKIVQQVGGWVGWVGGWVGAGGVGGWVGGVQAGAGRCREVSVGAAARGARRAARPGRPVGRETPPARRVCFAACTAAAMGSCLAACRAAIVAAA
jgi:hypothetical protein